MVQRTSWAGGPASTDHERRGRREVDAGGGGYQIGILRDDCSRGLDETRDCRLPLRDWGNGRRRHETKQRGAGPSGSCCNGGLGGRG